MLIELFWIGKLRFVFHSSSSFNREFHDIETGPQTPPMTSYWFTSLFLFPSLSPSNYSVFLASVLFPLFSRLLALSLFLSLPSGDGRESLHALGRSEWPGPAGSPSSGLLSFWREPPRRFSFYRFPPSLPPFPSPGPSPTSFP